MSWVQSSQGYAWSELPSILHSVDGRTLSGTVKLEAHVDGGWSPVRVELRQEYVPALGVTAAVLYAHGLEGLEEPQVIPIDTPLRQPGSGDRCSFCRANRSRVGALHESCYARICVHCLGMARAIAADSDVPSAALGRALVEERETKDPPCSFCSRPARRVPLVVPAPSVAICSLCITELSR